MFTRERYHGVSLDQRCSRAATSQLSKAALPGPATPRRWGARQGRPHRKGRAAPTPHSLLSHRHGHVVGHRPVDAVHTEAAQDQQLLEGGDVAVVAQGEGELLERVQVVPLGRTKRSCGGVRCAAAQALSSRDGAKATVKGRRPWEREHRRRSHQSQPLLPQTAHLRTGRAKPGSPPRPPVPVGDVS